MPTSATQPPSQLDLREDLRTRLGQGLIYHLHALTDDQMIAALRAYASARRLRLPPTSRSTTCSHARRAACAA